MDLSEEVYAISENDINRLVGIAEGYIGYRARRITTFYRLTLHTRQFKKQGFLRPKEIGYGWGTLGLSFTNKK